MEKKDILIALMYLPANKAVVMSPIQIMKSLFLFKMELKLSDEEFYKFEPYLYGPCSFEVYSDLDSLKIQGLVDSETSVWGWKHYRLTKKGSEIAKENIKRMDKNMLKQLRIIKNNVMSKSFIELLKYIYDKYPEYAKNSIINPEVLVK